MSIRRIAFLFILVASASLVAVLATRPVRVLPVSPGSFSFAALGDAPYYVWEDIKYHAVLKDIDRQELTSVIHVGDIIWHPCSDGLYRRVLDRFNHLRHPVIYTPGDNEWCDCWEEGSGAYRPLERLERLRQVFFAHPDRSLGGITLPLETQARDSTYAEFVENVRWMDHGFLFATVNLPGDRNARAPFPMRTAADDEAANRRTEAAAAWVRESFEEAKARNATGVIVCFHAAIGLENPAEDDYRRAYEPFVETLEEETAGFGKPVLLIHGDEHVFRVDHPLTQRTTGQTLMNLTRLEVPGSPRVGWVRVIATPGSTDPFRFEEHVLPAWKYW